jgi:Cu2+-exporting ATPase
MSDESAARCTLCDLPTPDSPVTDPAIDGEFCCRGCLAVAETLDAAPDAGDPSADAPDGTADPAAALDPGPDDADGATAYLAVDGMHCATCEAFVEDRATAVDGVRACDASYPAGAVRVVYDPDRLDPEAIAARVDGLGYDARPAGADAGQESDSPAAGANGDGGPGGPPELARAATTRRTDDGRLLVGAGLGMMTMVWYVLFLYPAYLGLDPALHLFPLDGTAGRYLLANVWVFATVVLGYTGWPLLRGAYVSLRARRPNMDLLVSLAAVTAYVYSTAVLLLGGTEVYFDITIVVLVAVTLGTRYERRLTAAATDRLAAMTAERADVARRKTGDGIEEVPIGALDGGDRVVVDPGERVPVDGTVVEGTAAVDRSLVTGESVPARVEPGDDVIGGAVVHDGVLTITVGDEPTSTLHRLLERCWDVRSGRSGVEQLADRLAGVFVPVVLLLAGVTFVGALLTGVGGTAALLTALTVLIVSCPCALGVATPLAIARGIGTALDRGIVVGDASVFERIAEAEVVAFDKTGTLTTGDMAIVETAGDERAPALAAAVERHASHPVAEAVVRFARGDSGDGRAGAVLPDGGTTAAVDRTGSGAEAEDASRIPDDAVSAFERHPGRGASARIAAPDRNVEDRVVVGSPALFDEQGLAVPDALCDRAASARNAGQLPVLVGWDGRARGLLVAADEPRPGWTDAVEAVADRHVVLLSGDDAPAVERFGDHPAVDETFAGVPPEGKAAVVERLRATGTTVLVGDGSNDAPALAAADLGVALGDGTALATDAADVVLLDGLDGLPTVLDLTRATRRRVRENLAWAFGYNAVAIPAAALGVLNPVVAAVAMAGSSLLVVGNATRSLLPGE